MAIVVGIEADLDPPFALVPIAVEPTLWFLNAFAGGKLLFLSTRFSGKIYVGYHDSRISFRSAVEFGRFWFAPDENRCNEE
jgi:hypothetical protein